jgi:hypothetical protein
MPLQQTSGNVTADAYGVGVAAVPKYIENFFSTWLRTGTGASATVTTGLDASTNKALVWTKSRSAATNHKLTDTVRGVTKALISNTTGAQTTDTQGLTAFSSTGYTIGTDTNYNNSGATYVDWEFAATPNFFDIVTYTGTGATQHNVSHNLGAVPGFVIVKDTTIGSQWSVAARKDDGTYCGLSLNNTNAASPASVTASNAGLFSTYIDFGNTGWSGQISGVNEIGSTYVAYLFAHNAGGFGLTGTDNVISCGSFTADGSGNANITLGYEPQWVLIKNITQADGWYITDTMRGMPASPATTAPFLSPNTSAAESSWGSVNGVNATGWNTSGLTPSNAYIYIAIRRGPMKVPTLGTSVFGLSARTGTDANATVTGGQTDDAVLIKNRGSAIESLFSSRLTGTGYLITSSTVSETAAAATVLQANPWDVMDGVKVGTTSTITNASANTYINYLFRRAPGFFDEVCYTGTGTTLNVDHNLAVAPELIIIKKRSATGDWFTGFNFGASTYSYAKLNLSDAAASGGYGFAFGAQPTTTQFTPGSSAGVNGSGATYVAYLFATCPGVSKVGSYTGNGTTQTINCGFTGGARFVLIKQTDSSGGWYVYDTARGMTTLVDPYLFLNSTAAETATLGSVTTVTTGFALNAALANVNISGGTYIFLAVA